MPSLLHQAAHNAHDNVFWPRVAPAPGVIMYRVFAIASLCARRGGHIGDSEEVASSTAAASARGRHDALVDEKGSIVMKMTESGSDEMANLRLLEAVLTNVFGNS